MDMKTKFAYFESSNMLESKHCIEISIKEEIVIQPELAFG